MNESKNLHQISLTDGKSLIICGVNSVLAFDDGYLKIDTTLGHIEIEGTELVIENLLKEKKEIHVMGLIKSIEIIKSKKSWY